MDKSFQAIYTGVLEGDQNLVVNGVQSALANGLNPELILKESLIPAMSEVGRLFEACEYYVPEMLISARAMRAGLKLLRPHLITTGVRATGRVVIGTAAGDLHDIGKNLVGMMLEGAGFEVIDLGTDVKPESYVEAVHQHQPDLVGVSALLTTTMMNMTAVLAALETAGLRGQVKVMVGGAPVTEEYAEKIGADGFAPDASLAVKTALHLMGSG